MPKNLTDVSQWLTIAVPVGTDPATAASIETTFQLLTDRTKFLIDHLMNVRLANWLYLAHPSFADWGTAPSSDTPLDLCYTENDDSFTAIDSDAITIISKDPGYYQSGTYRVGGHGEYDWVQESDNPKTCTAGGSGIGGGHASAEIASSPAGIRVAVGDNYTSGGVARSPTVGTWNGVATSDIVAWHCVAYGGGCFIIGGATGKTNRSTDGTSWSTVSGHGFTDTIRVIEHNGLSGGDSKFVALSATRSAYSSSDGLLWNGYPKSFGSTPLRLAYDTRSDTWRALFVDGSVWWSTNNGQSWTQISDPFGLASASPLVKGDVGLACDGHGGWVATYENRTATPVIDSQRWAVKENDFSEAIRTYAPLMYGCQRGGVIFGKDRFVTAGDAGSNLSLRLLE